IYSDTTPSALYRAPSRPRAAVVVKTKLGKILDQKTAETIIALVAAAKANLDEKDVQVTDDKGRHFTVIDREGLEAMGNVKWADEQRRNEIEQRKIENLIRAAVPGCEAYVFLDHKIDYTRRERHEVKYGEGTKVHTIKDKREMRTTKGREAEPGARTNVTGTVEAGGEREETTEVNSREEATIQPDKTETLEKPAPEVKALTIAAVVQMPYEYRKDEKGEWIPEVDAAGNPLRDEHGRVVRKKFSASVEEFVKNTKEKLERQIRLAAGMLPGAQNMEVEILPVPYPESQEFPPLPPPSYRRFWEWFRDNVIPFIMIFVILLFGCFLYAQAKRALPHEEAQLPEEEPLALIPEMSEMDKQQATFESMRSNIAKNVAEDPRKAANLLRRWMKRDAYS
ncbi:MAG: hypothetical protein N3A66_07765, partial [Planctomycetota bacterium]|nr:hypothetical protein [Planctomycetota bacterium]